MYRYIYTYTYIYINIKGERERERQRDVSRERERETAGPGARACGGEEDLCETTAMRSSGRRMSQSRNTIARSPTAASASCSSSF